QESVLSSMRAPTEKILSSSFANTCTIFWSSSARTPPNATKSAGTTKWRQSRTRPSISEGYGIGC
ncbi:hypothetical protein PENTCL1PPCAC_26032, partial [Pristionchus entomophagus]